MITKKSLSMSFVILLGIFFYDIILAELVLDCEELDVICHYEGKYLNVAEADKEFSKLLDNPSSEYFQITYIGLRRITQCADSSREYMETIKNTNCKVSDYIKKFISFYKSNKEGIKKNLEKEDPNSEVINNFNIFIQKYEG